MPPTPLTSYVTLSGRSSCEIEVRRSRFVCDLAHVETEAQAREVIDQVRSGSRDARHHCTAFVLGPGAATQRSNDDGEPSGTAGAPMLEVLRGRQVTDVVAVVTRWFGGVLLGTGGLIRAYGDAVAAAVDSAELVTMELREGLVVEVPHADGPRVENALRRLTGTEVTGTRWLSDTLLIEVGVTPGEADAVRGQAAALTAGRASVSDGAPRWVARPGGGSSQRV